MVRMFFKNKKPLFCKALEEIHLQSPEQQIHIFAKYVPELRDISFQLIMLPEGVAKKEFIKVHTPNLKKIIKACSGKKI